MTKNKNLNIPVSENLYKNIKFYSCIEDISMAELCRQVLEKKFGKSPKLF